MNSSSKLSAFVAYLLLIVGALFVLIFRRNDPFARFHARQSIVLTGVAVLAPLVWAVVGVILGQIPITGAILSIAAFAIVIIVYLFLIGLWLTGMSNALRAKGAALPVIGHWAERLPV